MVTVLDSTSTYAKVRLLDIGECQTSVGLLYNSQMPLVSSVTMQVPKQFTRFCAHAHYTVRSGFLLAYSGDG